MAVLLLSVIIGCEPKVVKETVVVERLVKETVIVEKVVEKIVTATPPPPTEVPPSPKIRMYLAPSTKTGRVLAGGRMLADMLRGITGYDFEIVVPTSYATVIKALCSGEADVAWLTSLAYVVADSKCDAVPLLEGERFGSYGYRAEIITQADKVRKARGLEPINNLEDLEGKSLAFTDPSSVSGYLLPTVMLWEARVNPGERIFTGSHAQVVLAVYMGDVDAGGCYWNPIRADGSVGDARRTLIEDFPDVAEKVKILALSDPIPIGVITVSPTLDPEVARKIQWALIDLAKTEEGRQVIGDLYDITGFIPGDRSRYSPLREAGAVLGYDFLEKVLE